MSEALTKEQATREALELALEALETNNKAWKNLADSGDAGFWEAEEQPFYEIAVKAIIAIKEALSSPNGEAQRKPLTREVIERDFYGFVDFVRQVEAAHGITTAVGEDTRRAWVGLDEIDTYKLWKNTPLLIGVYTYADVAKEVEALLKEKNI